MDMLSKAVENDDKYYVIDMQMYSENRYVIDTFICAGIQKCGVKCYQSPTEERYNENGVAAQ